MIQSSSCPQWQPDRPGPAGDHDGLAVVTPWFEAAFCPLETLLAEFDFTYSQGVRKQWNLHIGLNGRRKSS